MTHDLAVCSWSLQPDSPQQLVERVSACDLTAIQLHLDPVRSGDWSEPDLVARLSGAGIRITSGMMTTQGEDYSTLETIRETGGLRPDATWPTNLHAAEQNAELAKHIGISLVTLHAGFIPHDQEDPEYPGIIERIRTVADVFSAHGIRLGLETGQETAASLLDALAAIDRDSVGVNFDPANMILYAMGDPVEALDRLAPHVVQIHVKDAIATDTPGRWGTEVPAGTGQVDWPAFFAVVRDHLPGIPLVIEREAGDRRIEDIRTAASLVQQHAEVIRG
ncbi:MAG: sugar phosphate isomerase/epimerase family protein [Phycisphaerales bacterium]